LTDSRLDSHLFQGRGIGEEQPFLGAGGGENLELERLSRRHLDELAVLELVASRFEHFNSRLGRFWMKVVIKSVGPRISLEGNQHF